MSDNLSPSGDDTEQEAEPGPARVAAEQHLIDRMRSLHQSMEDIASSSSPLGQKLLDDLRAGTYDRIAPMVQALDTAYRPRYTTQPTHDSSPTGEEVTVAPQSARRSQWIPRGARRRSRQNPGTS